MGEVSPSKGRCFRFNCKNKEIMGVQITMNTRIRDMTSMLDTIKTRVWKTPEKLDAMRFLPHGIYSVWHTWRWHPDLNCPRHVLPQHDCYWLFQFLHKYHYFSYLFVLLLPGRFFPLKGNNKGKFYACFPSKNGSSPPACFDSLPRFPCHFM